MFVGRESELRALEDLYAEDRFQFVPITGRRRVGKTRLIEEFVKDKEAVFFRAVPGSESTNLSMFNELVSGDPEPLRLDRILWRAEERSAGRRLVVVIDEYPNLVEDAGHNSGLINNFIEAARDTSKLFLILCGSSMSIMESEVLGKKSPLYGRRTGQIRLRPFDFATSRRMLGGFGLEDAVAIYGLVGGIPYYLEQFDPGRSLEENIKRRYLDPTSVIAGEPELLFLTEFRKPATYYSVIHSMSRDRRTPSDIAKMAGMDVDAVSHALKKLIMLGLVRRDEPFGRDRTKDVHYSIADRLLASYFRFVYPDRRELSPQGIEDAWERMEGELNQYLGHIFEDICREFVLSHGYRRAGRWWLGQQEIDLVAVNDGEMLLAECKYRSEPLGMKVLDDLLVKSGSVKADGLVKRYALFSRSGFPQAVEARAESEGIELFRIEEMFGRSRHISGRQARYRHHIHAVGAPVGGTAYAADDA